MLEGDVEGAGVGVAAHVVDHHDAGMLQPGGHPRLGEEAGLEGLAVVLARNAGMDGLEGDGAPQDWVVGFVHDPHGPSAQLAPDLVSPDPVGPGFADVVHALDRLSLAS